MGSAVVIIPPVFWFKQLEQSISEDFRRVFFKMNSAAGRRLIAQPLLQGCSGLNQIDFKKADCLYEGCVSGGIRVAANIKGLQGTRYDSAAVHFKIQMR